MPAMVGYLNHWATAALMGRNRILLKDPVVFIEQVFVCCIEQVFVSRTVQLQGGLIATNHVIFESWPSDVDDTCSNYHTTPTG
ncbi:hypothetical protein TNCV_375901 [Trichonephila clavipes]|nr:hypothetical protein TNCV_375901 [Trichonephila clavipes]